MQLSKAGAAFIAGFEGFSATPYNDAANNATIGYGHLLHLGPVTDADRRHWGTITHARGLQLLQEDAASAASDVAKCIHVAINQHRVDALVSATFNCGAAIVCGSTLQRVLNAGDYRGVPAQLMRWDRAGGVVLAGLARRREAEGRLFMEPVVAQPHFPSYLTAGERELAQQLLTTHGASHDRAKVALIAQRKAIWRAAQKTGWGKLNRGQRYHYLQVLTA